MRKATHFVVSGHNFYSCDFLRWMINRAGVGLIVKHSRLGNFQRIFHRRTCLEDPAIVHEIVGGPTIIASLVFVYQPYNFTQWELWMTVAAGSQPVKFDDVRGAAWSSERCWTHDWKVVGSIPITATFACISEQVALLRLLSSFEWDVKPMFLVPGAYASGKQKTPSKWKIWVASVMESSSLVENGVTRPIGT
jgi:hypothetical protein